MKCSLLLVSLYLISGFICIQDVSGQQAKEAATSMTINRADSAVFSIRTQHYELRFRTLSVPLSPHRLAREIEVLHGYVAERLGLSPHLRLTISFDKPEEKPCGARARAMGAWGNRPARLTLPDSVRYPADPDIIIFVSEDLGVTDLLGILSHEVGHILSLNALDQGWGHTSPSNTTLVRAGIIEGIASWAAGRYWLASVRHTSFDEAVRQFASEFGYTPLVEAHPYATLGSSVDPANCYRLRDARYTQWASFTGYLIEVVGVAGVRRYFEGESLEELSGRSLAELEASWLRQVELW